MSSSATAHYLQFLIQYSSIALLYYDYLLTFGSEVKFVWRGKFRISTVLYVFCRYALVANVVYLLAIARKLTHEYVSHSLSSRRIDSDSCDAWYKFVAAMSLLGRASVIFVLGARTYAVFSCNRIILVIISILAFTCIGLSIVHVPGAKCVGANDNEKASDANAILTAFYETLVAALTLFRALQEYRTNSSWKSSDHGLLALLIDQGIVYFCITSVFTITTIVLNFTQASGTFFQRLLNALTLPLSCLLTARFLLQLREWQEKDASGCTISNMDPTGTLPAPSFVANFDAMLLDDFGNHDQNASVPLQDRTCSITL